VVVCDLEVPRMRRPWPDLDRNATTKKKKEVTGNKHVANYTSLAVILDRTLFL